MTYEIAHQLKAAGFPQHPKPGQFWHTRMDGIAYLSTIYNIGRFLVCSQYGSCVAISEGFIVDHFTFAPTLDDITPHLPQSFALEMWDGRPSCTNRDDAQQIRTFGETFVEAAARMWLELAGMRGYGAN